MNDLRFSGATALVAGGTGALGSAIAGALAQQGARVVVTYRSLSELKALQAQAEASGWSFDAAEVDITDESAVKRLAEDLLQRYSKIDLCVNAVGGFVGGAKLWELGADTLDRMLALNVRSIYNLARVVAPLMLRQGHGSIVNIAAKAGAVASPGKAAYAASKSGAIMLMESLAAELKGTGVRVNSVLPNIIDTPANRLAMPESSRVGWVTPTDVANVVVYLCSSEARIIHGASIPV